MVDNAATIVEELNEEERRRQKREKKERKRARREAKEAKRAKKAAEQQVWILMEFFMIFYTIKLHNVLLINIIKRVLIKPIPPRNFYSSINA